jgi:hypothetical protein
VVVFWDVTSITGRVLPKILKEHIAIILKSQVDRGEFVHLALENKVMLSFICQTPLIQ